MDLVGFISQIFTEDPCSSFSIPVFDEIIMIMGKSGHLYMNEPDGLELLEAN